MKKVILSLFLTLCSLSLFSQTKEETKAMHDYLMGIYKDVQAGFKAKDYESLKNNLTLAIDTIEKGQFKERFGNFQTRCYYNLACVESRLGSKEAAMNALEKAVEGNYMEYHHALKDSDLNPLREESRYKEIMQKWREKADFSYVLQQGGEYESQVKLDFEIPSFTYLEATDPNLVRVKEYFNLDSIAGSGDEISQIKNLLLWSHNVVRHDGNSNNPEKKNAIDIVEICKKENRGVNCRMMAQMLNECFLALGFKARYVTCLPKVYISDCHVINVVYSETLDKWLWVDPTFNAYVMDEDGNMLGIEEVRERLINNQALVLNEDANWNNKVKQTKEEYLYKYMAKNLYYLESPEITGFDTETNQSPRMIKLAPTSELPEKQSKYSDLTVDDAEYFWQKPQ